MTIKLSNVQLELLQLLAHGPRYGFTNFKVINVLVENGLARKVRGGDFIITQAGKNLLPEPKKFDQSNSQDCPGFVEAFRVMP